MTKQEIREIITQLSNDGDNLEVAISQLDDELVYTKPDIKKMLQIHKDMGLWVDGLETSLDDLEVEIKKIPNEEILNVLEEQNEAMFKL